MLSLETIKKDTLWVAKMVRFRQVGTYDELRVYRESDELRDFDNLYSQGQPEHLKQFWQDYEAQNETAYGERLFFMNNFYNEWIKRQEK